MAQPTGSCVDPRAWITHNFLTSVVADAVGRRGWRSEPITSPPPRTFANVERLLKFLGRARQFLQDLASEPASKVQTYNVACPNGHRVRGERTEGYQAIRCGACGEGVFVLPKSPLPNPVAPTKAASKSARPPQDWVDDGPVELTDQAGLAVEYEYDGADENGEAEVAADAEIIWDDPPSQTPAKPTTREAPGPSEERTPKAPRQPGPPAAAAKVKAPAHQPTKAAAPKPRSAAPAQPQPAMATAEPKNGPHRPRPVTLALWIVPLLVAATIGWRIWRQKRMEYPLVAERGRVEGIPSLDEGKFDKAHQLLSAAKTAVDSLGGAIDGAEEIRHAALEAAIFVDLCPKTLEEILEEAGRTDPAVWETRFSDLYKHHSLIIDSRIASVPDPVKAAPYDLEYRIFPVGGAVQFGNSRDIRPERIGLIDLGGFELLDVARPKPGDRVAFGARIASFRYDAGREQWVVGLEPNSGVFIEHTRALETLGWPAAAAATADDPEKMP
jgi:hypothetical protein